MNEAKEYKYVLKKDGSAVDKSLHGAFSVGDMVRFVLCCDCADAVMEIHRDGECDREIPFTKTKHGSFSRVISMASLTKKDEYGLFWYRYRITANDGNVMFLGGEMPKALMPCDDSGDRQLLVYRDSLRTPDTAKGCIIYHVFVDRFRRGGDHPLKEGCVAMKWEDDISEFAEKPGDPVKNDHFYGGDLEGVRKSLPYISSLGTEIIYLSPIFDSPSNHRYDTSDYMNVDPMLGGDVALAELCRDAKKFGICIILDGVFNHTGADSIYFNKYGKYDSLGACQSSESPYFPWYSFRKFPDEYECWWGVDIMPRVDSENKSYRNFIFGDGGVIRKYMRMGVGGWRLDVCDELSDTFLDELRLTVKEENTSAVIIGEVWEDASCKISYGKRRKYLAGTQLDSVMNYPFREAVLDFVRLGDHEKFRRLTEGIFRRYPEDVMHCSMNMLSTHDTVRAITALAGKSGEGRCGSELRDMRLNDTERRVGRRMLLFAFGLMCALPGSVSIFYGDETGLEGYRDPFCRRPYPWGHEDTELIKEFSVLGRLKRDMDVMRRGEFEIISADAEHLEIHRYIGKKRMICHFCRGDSAVAEIPDGYRILYGKSGTLGKWDMVFLINR